MDEKVARIAANEVQRSVAQLKAEQHDRWFRAKVQAALDDSRPAVPHGQVEAFFTKRGAGAMRREQS